MSDERDTRKMDGNGRIMIPIRMREKAGMKVGETYPFEIRYLDGHTYICIDCGEDNEVSRAMKILEKAGIEKTK